MVAERVRRRRRVDVLVDGGDGEDGRGVVEVVAQRRVEVIPVEFEPVVRGSPGGLEEALRNASIPIGRAKQPRGDVTTDDWPSEGKIRIRIRIRTNVGWDGYTEQVLTSCTRAGRRDSPRPD